jgi:hypothetical protein
MTRTGFDHRGPHGYGEIQMVSPMLTRWFFADGRCTYFTGGLGFWPDFGESKSTLRFRNLYSRD